MRYPTAPHNVKRRILKASLRIGEARNAAFRHVLSSVPKGKVSTYGKVAAAAGYPMYQRSVAQLLRKEASSMLPWQRIVGAGGEIRLRGDAALEQRLRLKMEGVAFRGNRVHMEMHEHVLHPWDDR